LNVSTVAIVPAVVAALWAVLSWTSSVVVLSLLVTVGCCFFGSEKMFKEECGGDEPILLANSKCISTVFRSISDVVGGGQRKRKEHGKKTIKERRRKDGKGEKERV
jgi:hypothetical protein